MTVLVALGAWIVHQLRYALAHGDDAGAHLAAHSHGYLDAVGPVLVWLVALAAASWVLSLSRHVGSTGTGPSTAAVWARASVALVAIYCFQEAGEGLLAPGHPDVLAGIFGSGGWIAVPLSIAVGAIAALAVRGGRAVRSAVARDRVRRERSEPSPLLVPHVVVAAPWARRAWPVLASNLAGRSPPLLTV